MILAVDLQRVCLKILSDALGTLNLDPLLAIFSRWRTEADHPAQWVDLADYAHMPRGPGIVLVGHRCNFSFDMGWSAAGVLYCSKKDLEGTTEERLRTVFRDCFALAGRLIVEPEFPAGIHLDPGRLELTFNDRLETPNDGNTDQVLRPSITTVLSELFGSDGYQLTAQGDPGRRYGFSIRTSKPAVLEVLTNALSH